MRNSKRRSDVPIGCCDIIALKGISYGNKGDGGELDQ